jgi:hypothetical protein
MVESGRVRSWLFHFGVLGAAVAMVAPPRWS